MRVSGGHLCGAEAPTEPVGETRRARSAGHYVRADARSERYEANVELRSGTIKLEQM